MATLGFFHRNLSMLDCVNGMLSTCDLPMRTFDFSSVETWYLKQLLWNCYTRSTQANESSAFLLPRSGIILHHLCKNLQKFTEKIDANVDLVARPCLLESRARSLVSRERISCFNNVGEPPTYLGLGCTHGFCMAFDLWYDSIEVHQERVCFLLQSCIVQIC